MQEVKHRAGTLLNISASRGPNISFSPSGAVRGLDGFYGTSAWGYMGPEEPPKAPKKILRPKGAPKKILGNKGAPEGLPMVQESPKKI